MALSDGLAVSVLAAFCLFSRGRASAADHLLRFFAANRVDDEIEVAPADLLGLGQGALLALAKPPGERTAARVLRRDLDRPPPQLPDREGVVGQRCRRRAHRAATLTLCGEPVAAVGRPLPPVDGGEADHASDPLMDADGDLKAVIGLKLGSGLADEAERVGVVLLCRPRQPGGEMSAVCLDQLVQLFRVSLGEQAKLCILWDRDSAGHGLNRSRRPRRRKWINSAADGTYGP